MSSSESGVPASPLDQLAEHDAQAAGAPPPPEQQQQQQRQHAGGDGDGDGDGGKKQAPPVTPPVSQSMPMSTASRLPPLDAPLGLPNAEDKANIFSRLSWWFAGSLLSAGAKKELQLNDLWELRRDDAAEHVARSFEREWAKEAVKPKPSLGKALIRAFVPYLALSWIWHAVLSACLLAGPNLIQLMIIQFQLGNIGPNAYLYALGIGLVSLLRTVCQYQSGMMSMRVGTRMRTAMMVAIYNKALRLSSTARQTVATGQIVSFMSNDAQRLLELFIFINDAVFAPLLLIVVLVQMIVMLGAYGLLFLVIVVLLVPVNGIVTRNMARSRTSMLHATDRRTRLINEVLNAMKVLKLYAWEDPAQAKVEASRDTEAGFLRSFMFSRGTISAVIAITPQLMALFTFLIRIGTDPAPLDAATVFGIIALLNVLRIPLTVLPIIIGAVVQMQVSLVRLGAYLLLPEAKVDVTRDTLVHDVHVVVDGSAEKASDGDSAASASASASGGASASPDDVAVVVAHPKLQPIGATDLAPPAVGHHLQEGHDLTVASDDARLVLRNATFSWDDTGKLFTLRSVSMRVRPGELVMVIGSVGSGKSALLNAVLGEMHQVAGERTVRGTLAYVPQQAWIVNESMRNNILFGSAFDAKRYEKTIDACALATDIGLFHDGDMVVIGERGVNLSGGQKQRVSLARAVYSEADLVLLDDPLSAVDAHVAQHLFTRCIRGPLRSKAVVLVTNQLQYLQHADYIVLLDNGVVMEAGTFKQLFEQQMVFAQLVTAFGGHGAGDHAGPTSLVANLSAPNTSTSAVPSVAALAQAMLESIEKEAQRTRTLSTAAGGDATASATATATATAGAVAAAPKTPVTPAGAVVAAPAKPAYVAQSGPTKLAEDEVRAQGSVSTAVYSGYISAGGVAVFVFSMFFFAAENVSRVMTDWWIGNYTGGAPGAAVNVGLFLGIYAMLGLLNFLFTLLRSYIMVVFGIRASSAKHNMLLRALLRYPMAFFDVTPMGRVMNRFTKDVDALDVLLPQSMQFFLMSFFLVVAMTGVMVSVVPWMLIPLVPLGILYVLVARYYRKSSIQLQRLESISRGPIFSFFSETLAGLVSIRAYGHTRRFLRQNERNTDANTMAWIALQLINQWLAFRLDLVGVAFIYIMATVLVALVGSPGFGYVTAGVAGLALTNALTLQNMLNRVSVMYADLETKMNAVERVDQFAVLEREAPPVIEDSRPPAAWPSHGDIAIDGISMRYRDGLPLVVRGVSVDIKGGQKVGIVGRTGAGKSSIMMSLFRIVELAGGKVTVDGVDIAKIGLKDLRSRLAIIPQEPFLFSGTIRTNLDPYNEIKDDDELYAVLKHVRLFDFVQSLPEKLDTPVSDDGDNFSTGQRQLVCLGRALLRKPKVLLMDEATASVDLETDMLIQRAVRTQFGHCTVLTIAHRLNTIMDYDRVLVLDQGAVAEYDKPATLLENKDGVFYSLVANTGRQNARLLHKIARGEASVLDEAVLRRLEGLDNGNGREAFMSSASQSDLAAALALPASPSGAGSAAATATDAQSPPAPDAAEPAALPSGDAAAGDAADGSSS